MSPATASMTCTLGSRGRVAAGTVATIRTGRRDHHRQPGLVCSLVGNCGSTVTVTAASPGTTRARQASPAPTGPAAMASVNLTVNATPPSLALGGVPDDSNKRPLQPPRRSLHAEQQRPDGHGQRRRVDGRCNNGFPARGFCSGRTATAARSPPPARRWNQRNARRDTDAERHGGVRVDQPRGQTDPPNLSLSGCTATNSTTSPARGIDLHARQLGADRGDVGRGRGHLRPRTWRLRAGGTGNCGTVTVTTNTAAGNYAGTQQRHADASGHRPHRPPST